jgi:hypothetical protein
MAKRCSYPKDDWPRCTVCDGRLHDQGCTSKRRKEIDCCPARHKMLHDQGITRGIYDKIPMWTGEPEE